MVQSCNWEEPVLTSCKHQNTTLTAMRVWETMREQECMTQLSSYDAMLVSAQWRGSKYALSMGTSHTWPHFIVLHLMNLDIWGYFQSNNQTWHCAKRLISLLFTELIHKVNVWLMTLHFRTLQLHTWWFESYPTNTDRATKWQNHWLQLVQIALEVQYSDSTGKKAFVYAE